MTSSITTRLVSANSSRAVKAPVRSVCTSNITASGLSAISTIDGSLTPAADDRFLLAGQTSSVDNGIYVASSGAWTRASDFNASRDVAKGTLIVTESGLTYRLTSANPITIGTTALTFASNDSSTIVASLASTAVGAGASLVGINDAGGTITATTVEAALQEISAAGYVTAGHIGSGAITPIKLATSALLNGPLVNGTLAVTVAANALTASVKTLAGTDPSATDPVYVVFRSATSGDGGYSVITLTAALSLTVSAGSTLGTTSATAHRVYVGIFNDAGTARLFVYNPYDNTGGTLQLRAIYEGALYSSSAEGGAGGADSPLTLYTSTVVSAKAAVLVGYFESTQATAGTWATAPSKIHVLRPNDKRTGDLVQTQRTYQTAAISGSASIPFDNTIPQNNEGDQYMQISMAPTNAANLFRVEASAFLSTTSAALTAMTAALFRSSTDAVAAASVTNVAANKPLVVGLQYMGAVGTTAASLVATLRAGHESTAITTFNGASGAGVFSTTVKSYLIGDEVFT